jgi:hypothetical protein
VKKICNNNLKKNIGTKYTQFHKSRKFFCFLIQGLRKQEDTGDGKMRH